MSDERILELIEKQDKYYVLGFINGIKADRDELSKENEELKKQLEEYKNQQQEFIKFLEDNYKETQDIRRN